VRLHIVDTAQMVQAMASFPSATSAIETNMIQAQTSTSLSSALAVDPRH